VRSLVSRCLAKDPHDRPTTGDLLAELGDVQLWAGWLPEPVLAGIRGVPAGAPAGKQGSSPPEPAEPKQRQAARVPAGRPLQEPRQEIPEALGTPPRANNAPPAGTGPDAPPAPRRRRPRTGWRIVAAAAVAVVAAAGVGAWLALHGVGASGGTGPRASTSATASYPATPAPVFSVLGASTDSCSGAYRSGNGRQEVHILFANSSSTLVQVFWLNFNGQAIRYVRLKPGVSQPIESYVGQYWLIADSAGTCLGVFGVDSSGDIVVDRT